MSKAFQTDPDGKQRVLGRRELMIRMLRTRLQENAETLRAYRFHTIADKIDALMPDVNNAIRDAMPERARNKLRPGEDP